MAHGFARIGRDKYRTDIEVGGHRLVADENASLGGADAGPGPYDLLLAGLGACTAIRCACTRTASNGRSNLSRCA